MHRRILPLQTGFYVNPIVKTAQLYDVNPSALSQNPVLC